MFGKLLALPFRVANIPLRAVERGVDIVLHPGDNMSYPGGTRTPNVISAPLKKAGEIAEDVGEVIEDAIDE